MLTVNPAAFKQWLELRFDGMKGRGPEYQIQCFAKQPFHERDCFDQGQHLWVNTEKGLFQCWLCKYAGSAVRLVKDRDRISKHEAETLLTEGAIIGQGQIHEVLDKLLQVSQPLGWQAPPPKEIKLPDFYEPLTKESPRLAQHYALRQRHLSWDIINRYRIGYCKHGPLAYRLVVPIYFKDRLVSYAARDASGLQKPKVLFPKDVEQAAFLFNYDEASRQPELVVTEGIFQALRVGRHAVAVFGSKLSAQQVSLLYRAKASKITIMFDGDTVGWRSAVKVAMVLRSLLEGVKLVQAAVLPFGDPDDYTEQEISQTLSAEKSLLRNSEAEALANLWKEVL